MSSHSRFELLAAGVMGTKIEKFISQIRSRPAFVAAAASDAKWSNDLDNFERGLKFADRLADSDPAMLEIVDKIQNVIGRNDLSLKQQLLEVVKLLTQARDAGRIVH